MEKLYSNIIGTYIFEDDSPRPFMTVKDIIIDPERGKLIGIVVNLSKNLIISPIDIVSWEGSMKIHNSSVIVEANEILRVEEVQKNGIRIFQNKVVTEDGENLGKVYDFAIDGNNYYLKKLFVAKSILGLLRYNSRIISADNIVEILPDKIVVKNAIQKVEEKSEKKVSVEDMAVS